tara:strand:- start:4200 stop:5213 length:1014 start_codon:yes stop_codon:yes gene_type:complete
MNNTNKYNLQYFLSDTSFKNWAKGLNKNDIYYWDTWLKNNPKHIEVAENAKSIIVGIKFKPLYPSNEKVNDELDKILPKIGLQTASKIDINKSRSLDKALYFSAAAVLLVLLSWSSLSYFDTHNAIAHKTNYGEIIDLKLPDGTTVVLNGNSEISYKKDNPRLLHLNGEAYFKVKSIPSTNAKFWVITNDLKVEVLGTQFHVNTRKQKTNVILDEGSIHLEFKNGEFTKMIPGEMVSFSNESQKMEHKKVSVETPFALWRGGTYSFNEIPLKDVMLNLELTYGLEIEYSSEHLKNISISGGIPNQNLKICIAAIEKATGTRIITNGNILQVQVNPIN